MSTAPMPCRCLIDATVPTVRVSALYQLLHTRWRWTRWAGVLLAWLTAPVGFVLFGVWLFTRWQQLQPYWECAQCGRRRVV